MQETKRINDAHVARHMQSTKSEFDVSMVNYRNRTGQTSGQTSGRTLGMEDTTNANNNNDVEYGEEEYGEEDEYADEDQPQENDGMQYQLV